MNRELWEKWSEAKAKECGGSQWLLSKWETIEGVTWSQKKIELMVKDIAGKLELGQEHSLLDVGCGGGWIDEELRRRCQTVFALDFAAEMLKAAASAAPGLELVLGEAQSLPFKAESFDRLLSYFMFINFPEQEKILAALTECLRVLKPGGICLAGQMPLKSQSRVYDREKERYLDWCRTNFSLGRDLGDEQQMPVALFPDDFGHYLEKKLKVPVQTLPSFNHFWREREPVQCVWRVDYLLRKGKN